MSTTQRVVRKQLAGAEDLLQGVGTVTQTRGSGSYPIHKLDIPIPTYDIAEMQASSAEFMRLYGTDTAYTDYRRNPEGTIGIPSNLGGVWEPMRSSESLVCGNFATGAYVFSSDCIVALDQQLYNWQGATPKVVAAGATPATSGGIGAGAWVYRTDAVLRRELAVNGDSMIGSRFGGAVSSDYAASTFRRVGTFSVGATLSSRKEALLHTDGLYYVWTGGFPKSVSTTAPDVYGDKWACVGRLDGYRVNEIKNFTSPGAADDSPLVRLALWSIAKLGLGELIITADCRVNIFTEAVVPFAIDGIPVAVGIKGEGVINSIGFVPEIRVLAGIRGLVLECPAYSLEKFVLAQYAGNGNLSVVGKTTNSVTVASNPFLNGSAILWPVSVTSTDGTLFTSVMQFSTNSGAFYASGCTDNGNGTYTITGVKGALGTPNSELANVTKIIKFTPLAHLLPDGAYPRTAAGITLSVAENLEVRSLWVLQMYRAFAHGDGNGAGLGVGLGHYGLWDGIITDGCGEFLGGTDISGGSIQGIEGGQFSNMHWYATRTVFNSRRMKNCSFSNCVNYAYTGSSWFKVLEIDGLSITGGINGWGTFYDYAGKLLDCVNIYNVTINGMKFGRHNTSESGAVIKATSRISNLTFTGNSLSSVSEGGFSTLGFIDTPELTYSCIGNNSVGIVGDGQSYITMSTTAPTKFRFTGTKFNQQVLTNAAAGVADKGTANTQNMMDSMSDYRDAALYYTFVDINSAATWPDENRNVIKFGGRLSPSTTLGLPTYLQLSEMGRSKVKVDLLLVVFDGQSLPIKYGASTVSTVSSPGVYNFELLSGQLVPS